MQIKTIIRFSRPHTIIGTVISITALYAMACQGNETEHWFLWIRAIVTGLFCNLFIVGINQIEDIELDKINKPNLPLASGELSLNQAGRMVWTSFWLALLMAAFIHPILIAVVGISMGIGWAYSCPPLYLRKHHLPAAMSIAVVRGLMVNMGGYYIFNLLINEQTSFNKDILILCLFITLFSIVIAWFKDLPDMKGDSQYKIKSVALLYTANGAIAAGHLLLIPAYCYTIWAYQFTSLLSIGHCLLLTGFLFNTFYLYRSKERN
ncbi:MAG: homogentisate phytyltransferase, partial [Chitinophagaceae bacterium]